MTRGLLSVDVQASPRVMKTSSSSAFKTLEVVSPLSRAAWCRVELGGESFLETSWHQAVK